MNYNLLGSDTMQSWQWISTFRRSSFSFLLQGLNTYTHTTINTYTHMHYQCNRSAFPPYLFIPWSWRRCVFLGIGPPHYPSTLDLVCLLTDCWCCNTVDIVTFYLKYCKFLKAPCLYFVNSKCKRKVQDLSVRSAGTESVCRYNTVGSL